MGGELVTDQPPTEHNRKPFYESFNELCPYYLSIGMTYNQFWNDDPTITKYYRKAEQIRNDKRNQELWLQGLYFGFAFGADKKNPYPSEPLPLTEKQAQEQQQRRYGKMVQRFKEQAAAINARKKGVAEDGLND